MELQIGTCPGDYNASNGHTGWNSNRQLTIMEILPHNLGGKFPILDKMFKKSQTSYKSEATGYGIIEH